MCGWEGDNRGVKPEIKPKFVKEVQGAGIAQLLEHDRKVAGSNPLEAGELSARGQPSVLIDL